MYINKSATNIERHLVEVHLSSQNTDLERRITYIIHNS